MGWCEQILAIHLQSVHNKVTECDKIGEKRKEVKQIEIEKQKKAKRTEIIGIDRGVIRVRIIKNLFQWARVLNQIEV